MRYEVTATMEVEADSESGAAALVADAVSGLVEDASISVGNGDVELDCFTMSELRR